MTDVRVDDVGKLFIINAGFDLSGNSDLRMVFKKTDGTVVTKTSTDGVVAPAVPVTVEIDGTETTLAANEYWQYPSEAALLTPAGTGWEVHGEYVDATPKDLAGDIDIFDVLSRT